VALFLGQPWRWRQHSLEMLVCTYKSTRRYNPEDKLWHLYRRENAKYQNHACNYYATLTLELKLAEFWKCNINSCPRSYYINMLTPVAIQFTTDANYAEPTLGFRVWIRMVYRISRDNHFMQCHDSLIFGACHWLAAPRSWDSWR
jgi:hypothetical protein